MNERSFINEMHLIALNNKIWVFWTENFEDNHENTKWYPFRIFEFSCFCDKFIFLFLSEP